jgi:F0F1-type ATP synthase beta subunit
VGCIHSALGKHFKVVIAILGLDEFFTNSPGQYVKLQATISGLTGLVDGMYDQWEEQAFYLIGDMSTLKESV